MNSPLHSDVVVADRGIAQNLPHKNSEIYSILQKINKVLFAWVAWDEVVNGPPPLKKTELRHWRFTDLPN